MHETPLAIADDKPAQPKPVSLGQAYECTAIGEVIRANDGKVPKNGTQLMKALDRLGEFAQIPVPFSAVALDSGLTHPRVVIAPRPGRANTDCLAVTQTPPPLSTAKATQLHFEGRLYFAANMEWDGQTAKVKTFEFISWNSRRTKFDFGVIDLSGPEPEIQILDGLRCFACHKNQGPIFGQGPWSNTTHNDQVRAAAIKALVPSANSAKGDPEIPKRDPLNPFGSFGFPGQVDRSVAPAIAQKTTYDSISLVAGEPEVCDAGIRLGGDLARDRELYRFMARTADGRKGLEILLAAIASPLPIDEANQRVKQAVDLAFDISSSNFANEFVSLNQSMSNTLFDYSPAGSIGVLRTIRSNQPAAWGSGSTQRTDIVLTFTGDPKKVTDYDTKRAAGDPGLPSNRTPSNPRSFIRTPVPVPPRPSAAANATSIARLIGLSEGDRQFMSKGIDDLVQKINNPKVTATSLARDLFGGPAFLETLKSGNVPDREEFKDRFVDGLVALAKVHKVQAPQYVRGEYASGPNCASNGKNDVEPARVPTTSCLHCHDIRGTAKQSAFNPIPMLYFDPFDKTARAKWVEDNDAKKRVAVLSRFITRLVTDKDMPPEDSAEYERFRQKDPASFDAVKDWLESELKKAKGN
jgi:hypothetical protein